MENPNAPNEIDLTALVTYLAHCNRSEYVNALLVMMQDYARKDQALRDAHDVIRALRGDRRNDWDESFERMHPYAGR